MKVSYIREMKRSYMVLEPGEQTEAEYEARMLSDNRIPGLLGMKLKYRDGNYSYCYDITSKQPLSRILESHSMTRGEVKRFLIQLNDTVDRMDSHLLGEGGLILEPEYIYLEPEEFSLEFCVVPGRGGDFLEELGRLFQYLLKHVDHRDRECVVLAYGLYQESLKENCGMEELMKLACGDGTGEKGKKEAYEGREQPDGGGKPEKWEKPGNYGRSGGDEKPGRWKKQGSGEAAGSREKPGNRKEVVDWESPERNQRTQYIKETVQEPGKILPLLIILPLLPPSALWVLQGKERLMEVLPVLAAGEGALLLAAGFVTAVIRSLGKRRDSKAQSASIKADAREQFLFQEEDWSEDEWQEEWEEPVSRESLRQDPPAAQDFQTVLLRAESENSLHRLEAAGPEGEDIIIPYFPFVIGKHKDLSDYVINRDTVSRFHLRCDCSGDQASITDLNSTNGTRVGGPLLAANETVEVQPGDEVIIADAAYIWR